MPDSGPSAIGPRGLRRWRLASLFVAVAAACGWTLLFAQSEGSAASAVNVWDRFSGTGPLWLAFGGLLIASGLISASETALFSMDKLDQSRLRGATAWNARLAVQLLDRPNDTLITILILSNFVNIAITLAVAALTGELMQGAGPETFTVSAVGATLSILLIGEILPKMLAHGHPRLGTLILAPLMTVASWMIAPLRESINLILGGLYRVLKIPDNAPMEDVSEAELKVMIASGEVSSVLEEDELEMIDGVFELRQTTIEEIMTPRALIEACPDDLNQAAMVQRLRESPNNRMLIYHETLDNLIGFLLIKEILLDPERPWRERIRNPLCVPEQMRLLDLLKEFRRNRMKMAIAVDEYGGVTGIVTLQEVLEEIVGDIYEKHEERPEGIDLMAAGEWRVNGSLDLETVGEELGVEFPTKRGRTIGGLTMNLLGRIPQAGDEIEVKGLILRVDEMSGRRVHRLQIRTAPSPKSAVEDASAAEVKP